MDKIELKTHKPMKPTRMTSIEENIQLSRMQQQSTSSAAAMYELKPNQKALKVLTVAAYILFVSMAAITLSFYYVFIWDPTSKPLPTKTPNGCDKIVIPEYIREHLQLVNSSDPATRNFLKTLLRNTETERVAANNAFTPQPSVGLNAVPMTTHTPETASRAHTPPALSLSTTTTTSSSSPMSSTDSTTVTTLDYGRPVAARFQAIINSQAAATNDDTQTLEDDEEEDDDRVTDLGEDGEYEASGLQLSDLDPMFAASSWNGTKYKSAEDSNNL